LLLLQQQKSMRTSFILSVSVLFLGGLFVSCSSGSNKNSDLPAGVVQNPNTASGKTDPDKLPKIEFEKDFHDFGKIIQGEKVSFAFKFRNTGKSLLLISNVSTSCGCTVTDFPKEPIKPGESGKIDVSFDSDGKRGSQNKTATVFANTQPNTTVLRIQSMVVLPDGDK
jgi:hypothetical protein